MFDHQNVQNKSCKHFRGTILLLQLGCSSRKCVRCYLAPTGGLQTSTSTTCNFAPYHAIIGGLEIFLTTLEESQSGSFNTSVTDQSPRWSGKFKVCRDWKKCNRFEVAQSRQFTTSKNVQTITLML